MADNKIIKNYITNDEDKKLLEHFDNAIQPYFHNKKKETAQFTDHGKLHISNVMENAYRLLKNKPFSLNETDYLYLIQSIFIHDHAMWNFENSSRDGHNIRIDDVLDKILDSNEFLGNRILDNDRKIICKIAAAHSGNPQEAYDSIRDEPNFPISDNDDPHILFLSMLLRISDELDITQDRIEGYSLKAILPDMEEESQKHWIKHKSIVKWEIDASDYSCLKLFLVSEIDKVFLPEFKLKFDKKKYMEFMCKCISKLIDELETVFNTCISMGKEANWKLKKVVLRVFNNSATDNYGYVKELDEMIERSGYNKKAKEEKNRKNRTIYNIDANIRQEQIEKKGKNSENIDANSDNLKEYSYTKIGENKYREKLDNYIQKKSMLRQGCYKHRELSIFTWLDSFEFHQQNFLLHITSNIFLKHIEQQDVDLIIGLGLKGSKIATVVGLKLEKPVYFFVNNDITTDNLDIIKSYNIVMITDCIITGETALSCCNKLKEYNINFNIRGVYTVFIRNHVQPNQNSNELMKKNIPIYVVNDTYSYTTCSFKDKNKCPLYISYGDKCYERTYKL
jgi:orotate phosphoribosyltransferase